MFRPFTDLQAPEYIKNPIGKFSKMGFYCEHRLYNMFYTLLYYTGSHQAAYS